VKLAQRALTRVGRSRLQAIRAALIETADRRRQNALCEEAKRLAADPVDRAEIAKVRAFMDGLAEPR
jgi:hypothetical protein